MSESVHLGRSLSVERDVVIVDMAAVRSEEVRSCQMEELSTSVLQGSHLMLQVRSSWMERSRRQWKAARKQCDGVHWEQRIEHLLQVDCYTMLDCVPTSLDSRCVDQVEPTILIIGTKKAPSVQRRAWILYR